jgi:glutaredoxin
MLTLYSRPGCIPCDALKTLFAEHNIAYKEIRPVELDQTEREQVFMEILKVSTIDTVSVPAARIDHGNHSHWVSSDGKAEVGEMFAKIQKLLEH